MCCGRREKESFSIIDPEGSVFTTSETGGWPQKIFFNSDGWVPYERGFNPFITRKVDEATAKEWATD